MYGIGGTGLIQDTISGRRLAELVDGETPKLQDAAAFTARLQGLGQPVSRPRHS